MGRNGLQRPGAEAAVARRPGLLAGGRGAAPGAVPAAAVAAAGGEISDLQESIRFS